MVNSPRWVSTPMNRESDPSFTAPLRLSPTRPKFTGTTGRMQGGFEKIWGWGAGKHQNAEKLKLLAFLRALRASAWTEKRQNPGAPGPPLRFGVETPKRRNLLPFSAFSAPPRDRKNVKIPARRDLRCASALKRRNCEARVNREEHRSIGKQPSSIGTSTCPCSFVRVGPALACDSDRPILHRQRFNSLEIAVATDQYGIRRQCGRRDPKVILIERQTFTLAISFDSGIMIARGSGDGSAGEFGEQQSGFRFQRFASLPVGQPAQSVQDFASYDRADLHSVVPRERFETGVHPHVFTHEIAERGGIQQVVHFPFPPSNSPSCPSGILPSEIARSNSSTSVEPR